MRVEEREPWSNEEREAWVEGREPCTLGPRRMEERAEEAFTSVLVFAFVGDTGSRQI